MKTLNEYPTQMIDDCRELYLKFKGSNHRKIEAEMRAKGWRKFSRQLLYKTEVKVNKKANWINRYGWLDLLSPKCRARLYRYRVARNFRLWLRATTPKWAWNWKHQV